MTDAALPVTERVVERFVESYLVSLGAEIHKYDHSWSVTLPNDAETDLELDGESLVVGTDPDEVSDEALVIAPESEFIDRVLEEAASRTPVGSLALTGENIDLRKRIPRWITAGSAEVIEVSFTPYYDRRALCLLFHIGIETVSRFQTEELRAVAVDLNSYESQPPLAETYLELSESDVTQTRLEDGLSLNENVIMDALDVAREYAEQYISPTVREIREQATRAAAVEIEEYQEFVSQRRRELDEEIARREERIAEVSQTIDDATDQGKRIEALRTRKQLRDERNELQAERAEIIDEIESGFPERRREIQNRHALTVRIQPVTLTIISYERGDIGYCLDIDDRRITASYAYAVGLGVMEDVTCNQCEQPLSDENPLATNGNEIIGDTCCDG